MSINQLIVPKLFETYSQISSAVKTIQRADTDISEKKALMRELRKQNEETLRGYNSLAGEFARSFVNRSHLIEDHIIQAKIGSPTPYGNQPKDYLWSGISIHADKSFSFQYSWVFQKDLLEVTFCFGSGDFSSGNVDPSVKEKKEAQMRLLEQKFVSSLMKENFRSVILQLLNDEGFIFKSEWLNAGEDLRDLESYISYIQKKKGSKTGITKVFKKDELLTEGFDLEKRLYYYFDLFRPIWEQLHFNEGESNKSIDSFEEVATSKEEKDNCLSILEVVKSYIANKGFVYPNKLIENFYLSLKTKPFVILAGVSGTGKTKLIKLFAEAIGATKDNGQFTLIPVRPDWSDPSDLIGYKDLSGTFRPGRLTEVLCEAAQPHNQHKPYFICLDEMNLARVEHYFSDMLSLLETQEWKDGRIVTAPLIHRSSLTTEEDRNRYGDISIPDNVYLIGTVNMDETTHPFSKKVLDRAHTIEFNNINLAQFPENSVELITPIAAPNDFLRSEYLQLVDAYATSKDLIQSTTETLVKLNETLEDIHAHVGFRIRDAMCFYMIYSQRDQLLSKDEAFDLQLLQKILPRIQGSSSSVKRALLKLFQQCVTTSISIDEFMDGADSQSKLKEALSQAKYPQSGRKLAFMLRRLEEDGFTSYWLS